MAVRLSEIKAFYFDCDPEASEKSS